MRVVISIFLTLVVFIFDPFGLKSATNDESVEIYSRVMSGFYEHTGQKHIAVALMTDKAAEEMAGGYPVPLRVHGEVVAAILCAGAKSVFIDINFRWERFKGDAEEFIDALSMRRVGNECRKLERDAVKKHPVRVILGHTPSRTATCDPIFPDFSDPSGDCKQPQVENPFAGLSKVATVISLPEPKSDLRYQLSEAARYGAPNPAYPISKFDIAELERRSLRLFSPAMASVYVLCADKLSQWSICEEGTDIDATLVTRWGWEISRSHRDFSRWLNGTCVNRSPGSVFLESRIRRVSEAGDVCPYHDTIVANDIRAAVVFGDNPPDTSRPEWTGKYILDQMFAGRAAFYGIQITGIGDYVQSPTLGRVPGVYAHAMALDNLLTEGNGFWREPKPVLESVSTYWTWSLALELFLGLALLLFGWRVEERNDAAFNRVVLKRGKSGIRPRNFTRRIWSAYDKVAFLPFKLYRLFRAPQDHDGRPGFVYNLHRARKWLFFFLSISIVCGITILEIYRFSWPPNDWIVLSALIIAAKPGHRKYAEWVGKNNSDSSTSCKAPRGGSSAGREPG